MRWANSGKTLVTAHPDAPAFLYAARTAFSRQPHCPVRSRGQPADVFELLARPHIRSVPQQKPQGHVPPDRQREALQQLASAALDRSLGSLMPTSFGAAQANADDRCVTGGGPCTTRIRWHPMKDGSGRKPKAPSPASGTPAAMCSLLSRGVAVKPPDPAATTRWVASSCEEERRKAVPVMCQCEIY